VEISQASLSVVRSRVSHSDAPGRAPIPGGWIAGRYGTSFPYGTLIINVTRSFVIGFFLALISERFVIHPNWRLFFAIGFLGAYTTFSTFSFETFALIERRAVVLALANGIGSVLLGQMAIMAGVMLARLF
jgi:CrcB protein